MLIHIQRDGHQFGPYTLEDLNQYLVDGSLLPSDLAWYEGVSDWIPMNQVPGVVMPLPRTLLFQETLSSGRPIAI